MKVSADEKHKQSLYPTSTKVEMTTYINTMTCRYMEQMQGMFCAFLASALRGTEY